MKFSLILFFFYISFSLSVFAQKENTGDTKNGNSGSTYGEFKSGYGITRFKSGLRERFETGNFSTSGGGLFSVAAYRKFNNKNNLHVGLKFKSLGAAASEGANNDEMFFNFWAAGFTTKYFLFPKSISKRIYLQGDYNFVTQFTQKYRNSAALKFDHQFAIGRSLTLGLGYQQPLKNRYAIVASLEYDLASRQGEVQGIGDKQFKNSNIAFQLGLIF